AWPTRSPISDQTSAVHRGPTEFVLESRPASIDLLRGYRVQLSFSRRCFFRRKSAERGEGEVSRMGQPLPRAFVRMQRRRVATASSEFRPSVGNAQLHGKLHHRATRAVFRLFLRSRTSSICERHSI